MLWLAVYLPWLPLEALPVADGRPRCVIEQRLVLASSAGARAAGIACGMSAATAGSLAPEVQQLARDPAREAAFVQALALALARYTPHVVVDGDAVLLEVAATLRLFGGVRALMRQVRATARGCGARVRLALAPTAGAAALLARVAPARALQRARTQRLLDALPLSPALQALQQPPRLAQLLQTIGCVRLGEVRVLPRAGLRRRGGGELVTLLDRACGDAPDPRPWLEVPERFAMPLELMHRADDAAQLVFACQRLVVPLAGWLSRQWLAASRLTLKLRHERSLRHSLADGELVLELGAPSRDAAQVMALLRERLQRHVLAAPVYAIELRLDDAVSSAGREGQLLPEPGQQAQEFQALIDRLASRLGRERVLRVAPVQDHRPERASMAVSAAEPPPPALSPLSPTPGPPLPRPTWLLREPLRLAEEDGVPVHGGPLALLSRAERIEAGWFDGAPASRDYHVAQGPDQRLRWIYRERVGHDVAWYLHGLFA
jgi:protein ImuB